MKKWAFLFIISLIILTGCSSKKNINNDIKNGDNCMDNPRLVATYNDRNIYLYCLDVKAIKIDNEEIILEDYLKNNPANIEKVIEALTFEDSLDDGGTLIYSGEVKLVKCNSLIGNKNIYIGNNSNKSLIKLCENS